MSHREAPEGMSGEIDEAYAAIASQPAPDRIATHLAILVGTLGRCPVAFCEVVTGPHHERCPFGGLIEAVKADSALRGETDGAES